MDYLSMSDRAILREIGRRLRRRRLDKNWSQNELAERSGLSRTTVSDLEREGTVSLLTVVQVLRALDELDGLDGFLPDSGPSPLELAKLDGRVRQRASRRSGRDDEGKTEW
jgi:transcriptional regulator with XRE-family HTH domain